jgi:hypothetical protein
MEEIINFDFLKNPLKDSCDVKKTFGDIAKKLFQEYCINCNGTEYYFAEIEFYYYEQGKWDKNWNDVTYERNANAGDLFYHLSGVDICFLSALTKEKGKKIGGGGGILIRSIWDGKNKESLIVGPLTCVNEMLNACKGGRMPELKHVEKRICKPKETYRYLGKKDFDSIVKKNNRDGKLKLAFYNNTDIDENAWNKARSSYYSKRLTKYDTKSV